MTQCINCIIIYWYCPKNLEVLFLKLKKLLAIILTVLLAVNFTSCIRKTNSNKLKLVTSFYPIYIMALNITDGVDKVELVNMAEQNTGCLHDFQLRTEDMKNIESANALIINGAGMESFLDKILEEIPNKPIIDSSVGIDLLKSEGHHHDEDGDHDDHDDDSVNSHIWVSISNYIEQVKNISEGIISLDPENKVKYQSNTEEYISKLYELRDEMHNGLNDIAKRDIITLHESFDYFAEEFNLNIEAVINHEPNTEPSSKEIKETIEVINKEGNNIPLFVEPQYPSTSAEIISRETGAKVYMLDSCVTGDISKDAYIEAMKKNLSVLKEALS